ncbi:MAG: alpha/beta hydrolase [Polyangiaceae bacterium]|nr:alpha/beta hydrolase [Polyangiaceae bacterium]
MGRNLELAIGALNGAVGDYLERTNNGLATAMQLLVNGKPVAPAEASRSWQTAPDVYTEVPRRLVILVHGLMSTEDVFRFPDGETYASMLARDFGFAPLELRYNSGRRISENGRSLDELFTSLDQAWPVPLDEFVLIGHSMGGLVIRGATHAAAERESGWLSKVRRAFYLGAPHLGAPLERFGNAVSWALHKVGHPVTRLIADIVNLRSVGVKDLRYGNLRREDWEGHDADALLQNTRHPVPLLPHIRHHLIVVSLFTDVESAILLGDALVPVRSAAGRAKAVDRASPFPQEHVRILPKMSHLRLAHDPNVYAQIRAWCEEPL